MEVKVKKEVVLSDEKEMQLFVHYAKLLKAYDAENKVSRFMLPIRRYSSKQCVSKAYNETKEFLTNMKELGETLFPDDYWEREYVLTLLHSELGHMLDGFITGKRDESEESFHVA